MRGSRVETRTGRKNAKRRTPESYVLQAVMDYLAAKRVLAFRMNTGTAQMGDRYVSFGVKGMADVLALPKFYGYQISTGAGGMQSVTFDYSVPTWIECKAEHGKQSAVQKSFQELVESHGHRYFVVRSIEELKSALGVVE